MRPAYSPADCLAPFHAAVLDARAKMDAPHASYGSLRRAQGDYHEAVDTLRKAEYQLSPADCDRHYLTAR
jgi:Flp pilus assembly protein TadD